MTKQHNLNWADFEKVDLRVGTIIEARQFPEARKPAYQLIIDFGEDVGVKQSSAQITEHYQLDDLVGKQILAVVNFPPKQIGPFMSECLVTGLVQADHSVILLSPDQPVANGLKLA